jgi:lysophospholipase L1-like esterase
VNRPPSLVGRWIRRIALALLPLCVLLALSEMVLTLLDVGTPFTRSPRFASGAAHIAQKDKRVGLRLLSNLDLPDIKTNSLGFRTGEIKANADVRILCLGDSTTFGWGLPDASSSYASRLETMLADSPWADGRHRQFEVFNAGVPSFTLYQGLQLYIDPLIDLARWDYVIATFGWNERPGVELDLEFAMRNPPIANALARMLRPAFTRLRTYNAMESVFWGLRYRRDEQPEVLARQQYATYYEQLIALAKSRGSRVTLLPVVMPKRMMTTPLGTSVAVLNQTARAVAERQQVSYIDIDVDFQNHATEIGWYDEFHYDHRGHEVIAERLAKVIFVELSVSGK